MARIIVTAGADANLWARQFCRELPWTRAAGVPAVTGPPRAKEVVHSTTRAGIVVSVVAAARRAGAGGEVIYSIGHGNAAAVGANAQLAPGADFTVTQEMLAADGTGRRVTEGGGARMTTQLSQSDQAVNAAFRQIGAALIAANVSRFTFLVCALGNNTAFLTSIKRVWGGNIEVAGYRGNVATVRHTFNDEHGALPPKIALYLSSDPAGTSVIGRTDAEANAFLELPATQYLSVA